MPRLSILIPVLGDPKRLDDTLVSVLENRPADCEILVFHNQPYHDPYDLAGEVRFFEVDRKAGVVECLNLGLYASLSPVVHALTCGVEVFPGWADAAMRHFRDPQVASVAAVVLDRADPQKVLSAGLGYRVEGEVCRLGLGDEMVELGKCQSELCGPDLLAAFYCKSTLQEIGGFSPWATGELTGIDAALAIRRAGFRCAMEPGCLAKAAVASIEEAPAFRLGRDSELLFWRWASDHGWMRSVVGHAALAAGQCVLGLRKPRKLILMAGRAWGAGRWMLSSRRSQQAERLDDARSLTLDSPRCHSGEETDHCRRLKAA